MCWHRRRVWATAAGLEKLYLLLKILPVKWITHSEFVDCCFRSDMSKDDHVKSDGLLYSKKNTLLQSKGKKKLECLISEDYISPTSERDNRWKVNCSWLLSIINSAKLPQALAPQLRNWRSLQPPDLTWFHMPKVTVRSFTKSIVKVRACYASKITRRWKHGSLFMYNH